MPKMKTKKSAAKRFKVTGKGVIKRARATKRPILTKRTTKNKRQLRGMVEMAPGDARSAQLMMPYASS